MQDPVGAFLTIPNAFKQCTIPLLTIDSVISASLMKNFPTPQLMRKEMDMAVKIFIKRKVPENSARGIIQLFRRLRRMAMEQEGYISGETLRNFQDPEIYLVISSWQSAENWQKWFESPERKEVQGKIDTLLGGKTEYEIFQYGLGK